jgi:hypothetical protein
MLFMAGCCAGIAVAQAPAPRVGDMGYLSQSDAWLGSENAAGLQSLPDSLRLSTVAVYLHKGNGAFVNYHESDNSMEAGALTESYYRLNPRVVFYGRVHYGYFSGRNMGGSAWIDPYDTPFDLVEAADNLRGVKNLERYRLTGALSVTLWRGLSLGGRVDYQAANYAKTRDPRHVNKYSDLAFSVGARYASAVVELGLNGFYRHDAEDVKFSIEGNTGRLDTLLVSFGGFFGRPELFSETGENYTAGNGTPLFNTWYGAAVQASLRFTAHWKLFLEASGKWRSGYYGKRSTATTVFTGHEGGDYTFSGTLSYRRNAQHHLLKAVFRQTPLKNFENIRDNNTVDGRTEVIYYGKNIVRDARRMQAGLTYTGYFGVADCRPLWRVEAGAEYARMSQTVSQYPYYRKQRIYRYNFFLNAARTVEWQANEAGLLLGAAAGRGGGAPKNDGMYNPPSSTQKPPGDFDNYLYHEFDYLTASRVGGLVEGTYARRFRPHLRASVSLRYELTHALQPVRLPGNVFHFVSLSVECTF